jgi:ribokinase
VEALAAFAAQHGIPLMLDPAPARELPASLLRQLDWITPNETEAQHLLGHALPEDDAGLEAAADELLQRGVANVLLKLGARGCLIAQKGQAKRRVPAFAVTAVDTTAAGDAFNAAFAVGMLRGESPANSARFAAAVAAISVTRPGAQPSMPTAADVKAFLDTRQ